MMCLLLKRIVVPIFCLLASIGGFSGAAAVVPDDLFSSPYRIATRDKPSHVAVVCPVKFHAALKPWISYRQEQGYTVYLLTPEYPPSVESVIRNIRDIHQRAPLSAVLLVGPAVYSSTDSLAISSATSETESLQAAAVIVPTGSVPTCVIQHFGPETDIATDNVFADMDDDGVPDVPVGRIPVHSPADLTTVISKIIQYETEPFLLPTWKPSDVVPVPTSGRYTEPDWRTRISFITGEGGFSPVIDFTLESATRILLSKMIPNSFGLFLLQASWQSPYCPAPPEFSEAAVESVQRGGLFWVYIGHGSRQRLRSLDTPIRKYSTLAGHDTSRLSPDFAVGRTIMVLLACYTGAFDMELSDSPSSPSSSTSSKSSSSSSQGCFAAEWLQHPSGPIAVLASTRTTMPYGMTQLGIGMMETVFSTFSSTPDSANSPQGYEEPLLLGTVFLESKRQAIAEFQPKISRSDVDSEPESLRKMFRGVASLLDPTADRLELQCRDHLAMFHLFGDPLLRIQAPRPITLESPSNCRLGETIRLSGQIRVPSSVPVPISVPISTETSPSVLTVELRVPITREMVARPFRSEYTESEEMNSAMNTTFGQSNRRVVWQKMVVVSSESPPNSFDIQLTIPPVLERGEYVVWTQYQTPKYVAVGAKKIEIE